ncbi:MAG: hypothetical protein ACLP1D_16335 [Xanthobacteraceae bacterium]|jgi:hypothetical protein
MSVVIELPDELAGPLQNAASELNVDPARYIAALVREKLRLPVRIGDLEIFAPADIMDYELEREPGESDEDYEAAKATFGAVFKAALK